MKYESNNTKTIRTDEGHNTSFYDKVFTCGHTHLTRRELESLGCPFYTKNVTDEVMRKIASVMNDELAQWNFKKVGGEELEFTCEDARFHEMDNAAVKLGVPYYEDLKSNEKQ